MVQAILVLPSQQSCTRPTGLTGSWVAWVVGCQNMANPAGSLVGLKMTVSLFEPKTIIHTHYGTGIIIITVIIGLDSFTALPKTSVSNLCQICIFTEVSIHLHNLHSNFFLLK